MFHCPEFVGRILYFFVFLLVIVAYLMYSLENIVADNYLTSANSFGRFVVVRELKSSFALAIVGEEIAGVEKRCALQTQFFGYDIENCGLARCVVCIEDGDVRKLDMTEIPVIESLPWVPAPMNGSTVKLGP